MAKAKVTPEVETEELTGMTPKALASELEISAKALRGWLRKEFPRDTSAKNTSWRLSDAQVEAATAHFAGEDDEDESDED